MSLLTSRQVPLASGMPLVDTVAKGRDELEERRIHGTDLNMSHTILVIIISAIIFVTVIAFYDTIKAWLNYSYGTQNLSAYTAEEQNRIREDLRSALFSALNFCVIAVILALIFIPLLVSWIRRSKGSKL